MGFDMPPISFNGRFLLAPPTGVQRVARELIRAFDQLDIEDQDVELVCPKNVSVDFELNNITIRSAGRLTSHLWEQFELPRLTKGRLLINLCNLGPVFAKDAITMIHDAQTISQPKSYSFAFRKVYQFALPRIGANNKKILTVSNKAKAELVQHGVAEEKKIHVVPNGVDHILRSDPDREVLEKLGLTPGRYCLGLANTQPHKNLQVVTRAFAAPELADFKVVLFGSADRDRFEQAGIAVPHNVVFAGFVSEGELRSLIENALSLVFPSKTEGFGLPPLEAMTLGTPAICAPEGALPEVCGSAALYADADDPIQWIQQITSLAAEDRQQREQRKREAVQQAQKFTWTASATKFKRLLESVKF